MPPVFARRIIGPLDHAGGRATPETREIACGQTVRCRRWRGCETKVHGVKDGRAQPSTSGYVCVAEPRQFFSEYLCCTGFAFYILGSLLLCFCVRACVRRQIVVVAFVEFTALRL